jgi:adenine-specific DNA methylase
MSPVRLLSVLLFISPTAVMAESTSLSNFNACHDFSNHLMIKLKKDVVKEMAEDEFNQALIVVMENCHQLMQDNGRVVGASDVKN